MKEIFQLYYNFMGPLSYMCSIIDLNVVMWFTAVYQNPAPVSTCTSLSMCLVTLAFSLLVYRCSTLILQPCGTPDPLLLQPQVLGKKWDPGPWEEVDLGKGKVGAS